MEFSLLARVLLLVLLSLTVERVRLLGQTREVKALLLLLLRERLLLHSKLRVHAAGREETHLLLIEPGGTPNTGDDATAVQKTSI